MNTIDENLTTKNSYFYLNKMSWGAIFAGTVIALFIEFLLNLAGLGLGLTTFNVDTSSLANIGTGTVIWLIITGIIAMFVGGWGMAQLASYRCRMRNTWHGLTMAGLVILVSFMLVLSATGAFISGLAGAVTQTMSVAGQSLAAVSQGMANTAPQLTNATKGLISNNNNAVSSIIQKANQLLTQTSSQQNKNNNAENATKPASNTTQNTSAQSVATLKQQLSKAVTGFLSSSENNQSTARQQLVDFLTTNTNLSPQQAGQMVDQWQQQYQAMKVKAKQKLDAAKQKAKKTAQQATHAVGTVALIATIVFLISALAAMLGAVLGTNARGHESLTEREIKQAHNL